MMPPERKEKEVVIGDRVLATMNGKDWFPGVLCGEIDLFVPYGVRVDDGELRYFADVKPEAKSQEGK